MNKDHREKAEDAGQPDTTRERKPQEPNQTSNPPYGKEEHMNEELANRIEEGREPS